MWDWKFQLFYTDYGGYANKAKNYGEYVVDAIMDEDIDNNTKITTTNTLINPTGNYHR